MNLICRFAPAIAATALLAACAVVSAQQEFPPPQGKGPVVVVASGISGPEHYKKIASDIAALGYDAVLFDGSAMEHTQGAAVRSAIVQAQQMPHALPGKVAIVGFSAGGGEAVIYATGWPDLVTGVIACFPST
jgi:dienelactone hydrolase